jgi:ketosteroid isomerase-like protein
MTSNVRNAEELYAAFARGDIPAVLAMCDSELQWSQAEGHPYQPDGAAWFGAQTVLEKLFKRIGSEWEDFKANIRAIHDAGEYIVVEGRYTGIHKPSSRSLDAQMCHVLRFRNGKLYRFQQYVDTAQLQAVMVMY